MRERAAEWLKYVIKPALGILGSPYSGESIEQGLLVTGWHESARFTEIAQRGTDHALGPWQMERLTFDDLWDRWLELSVQNRGLKHNVMLLAPQTGRLLDRFELLASCALFACAMARIKYRTIPEALPAAGDAEGWARYWKRYYNSMLGAGKEEDFLRSWDEVYG